MDQKVHDIAVINMALDDFRNYAAAKIEVYQETLVELGARVPALSPQPNTADRERIDAWKARIRAGDDHYPGTST